jgi:hypothetical protein
VRLPPIPIRSLPSENELHAPLGGVAFCVGIQFWRDLQEIESTCSSGEVSCLAPSLELTHYRLSSACLYHSTVRRSPACTDVDGFQPISV